MIKAESSEKKTNLYSIVVDAPITQALTYSHIVSSTESLARGQFVKVPLGLREVMGVITQTHVSAPDESVNLKPITSLVPELPVLSENRMKWMEWLAHYYYYPLGKVVQLSHPPLHKKKGRPTQKKLPLDSLEKEIPHQLTFQQKQVIEDLQVHLQKKNFSAHLLHGVTGSGKTEIYLQLINQMLLEGSSCLVLVPEISLTPQLLKRFISRFPHQIALFHSHLTPRERTDQWWSVVEGKKSVLLGTRSAIFCPLPRMGLIILDEEHESSFKQEDHLKYHARDSAVMLARMENCPILLGSATPSMETWNNVQMGRYHLHTLSKRVAERPLPVIEVVPIKKEREKRRQEKAVSSLPFWLSDKLYMALQDCFQKGDQAALFLNRRGVAHSIFCPDCGCHYACPNCSITLTLHGTRQLICHYCDYTEILVDKCKECGSTEVGPLGLGTEKIEQDMKVLFPEIKIGRADRDEIQSREDLEELISSVENRKIQLLIGTQMIAKGLDFKGLNLVGLVLADVGFHLPDFRASERSFQLLIQVSGRAGRHSDLPGQVIVQTYNPQHPSILYGIHNKYAEFAQMELEIRKQLKYPPFSRLASVRFQGYSLDLIRTTAHLFAQRCHQLQIHNPQYQVVSLLGPAPSPIAKLKNKFRFQILLKSPEAQILGHFYRKILSNQKWIPKGVRVLVDIDPVHLL